MTTTLNTSHVLYPNLVELICVSGGAPVSLKTARTFTNRAAAPTYGTGTYGEHMVTNGNGYSWSGIGAISPAVAINNSIGFGSTIVIVGNSFTPSRYLWGCESGNGQSLIVDSNGLAAMTASWTTVTASAGRAGNDLRVGAHMVAVDRAGGDPGAVMHAYVDGVLSDTSTDPNFPGNPTLSSIGGIGGYVGGAAQIVYLIVYNKVLSAAEISALYATLGPNTFGPVTIGAADTTAPTLTGAITVGTVTSSSIQITWPAGADNVAVTSYETSPDGTTWTDRGNVLTYTFTGLAASTSYTFQVRAKDAAANVSTPALSVTQSTSAAVASSDRGATTSHPLTGFNTTGYGLRR